MLIKRTKERSPEITPDNRGVIWGKELNGMATDEELYGQYLSGDETGLELLIKKYGDPLTLYIDGYLHDVHGNLFLAVYEKAPHPGWMF